MLRMLVIVLGYLIGIGSYSRILTVPAEESGFDSLLMIF